MLEVISRSRTAKYLPLITLGCIITVGACSRAEFGEANPWGREISDAKQWFDSEFIHGVLDDGIITESEVHEVRTRIVDCLTYAGIPAQFVSDPLGQITLTINGALTALQHEIQLDCESEWGGPILGLHHQMTVNPNNEDWDTITAACLVRNGLAPSGFTAHDLAEVTAIGSLRIDTRTMSDEEIQAAIDAHDWSIQGFLPNGLPPNDPPALLCSLDPRVEIDRDRFPWVHFEN